MCGDLDMIWLHRRSSSIDWVLLEKSKILINGPWLRFRQENLQFAIGQPTSHFSEAALAKKRVHDLLMAYGKK